MYRLWRVYRLPILGARLVPLKTKPSNKPSGDYTLGSYTKSGKDDTKHHRASQNSSKRTFSSSSSFKPRQLLPNYVQSTSCHRENEKIRWVRVLKRSRVRTTFRMCRDFKLESPYKIHWSLSLSCFCSIWSGPYLNAKFKMPRTKSK